MKVPPMRLFATEAADFTPDLLTIQEQPPSRLPRTVGYVTVGLFGLLLVWATFGKLDIIAGAEGRLVPRNYSRVLQPAEAGIVREVLVRDGEEVKAGQVLMRMDATTASADMGTLKADAALKALGLRRIDAELRGQPLLIDVRDPPELAVQVLAQYRARRQSHLDALAQEQATLERAQHDLMAARQQLAKLQATVPLYQQSANSYEKLVKEGFVSELGANDKLRERIEKEQELKTQEANMGSMTSAVEQSRKKLAQIKSGYESQLLNERVELQSQQQRTDGELQKQVYKSGLLALKATGAGTIKDMATYSPGAVVQPGAALLNLVPKNEPLFAEVAIHNEDVGFVAPGQSVKVKLQAYPFQKYGMLDGTVELISADSSANDPQKATAMGQSPQSYKALVKLASQELRASNGEVLKLTPGMVVQAEIHQGQRTVLEYLLSPVQKVAQEAGRER
ncbi:Type I secretion membrane fusion protein, HlyD [Rhodoferax ferrireducens T118]|uniref:Membrane fusion protein (MFP) family protein n=2 Tax=Rhodoferax ferrireducens TaxID=192843 RepID=Q21UX5_ALBFT|nr:Type I secretion membrane fusion protein, HlyD [Rhodoferax ferrireducens T118]